MIRSLARAPALHFLCLGACLVLAERGWYAAAPPAPAVSDEELLYQAALEAGVDRTDRAVRERLARLGGFVGEDGGDETALEAEARRLGLARSDLVVRRHLVQMMQLAAGRLGPGDVPTDDELAARTAELAVPARVRFTHVYVSHARHGSGSEDEAHRLLDALDHVSPEAAARLGDAFPMGAQVGPATDADLDRRFGAGFAAALATAPTGKWAGPFPSSYGLHVVWVEERLPPTTPNLASVRGRLVHRILRERRDAKARERIAALRAR